MSFRWLVLSALLVFLACVKTNTLAPDLDEAVLERITDQIRGEYTAKLLETVNQQAPSAADAKRLLTVSKLELTDVTLKRLPSGSVVRVTPKIEGGPPDGKTYRYYLVAYDTMSGWRLKHEVHEARFNRVR